jgi:predicted transcriptional regulator
MISPYDIDMRTLVDLPQSDIRALDRLARREDVSRTELVRRAVADYLERQRSVPADAFGAWAAHDAAGDGLAYERGMREEW